MAGVGSLREAARLTGVSAPTVGTWVARGYLPVERPWTRAQVRAAARRADRRRTKRQGQVIGSSVEHGTADRWRLGCECGLCTLAHATAVRDARISAQLDALLPCLVTVLEAVRTGVDVDQALDDAGCQVRPVQLYHLMRVYPDLGDVMDAAIRDGHSATLAHGTAAGRRARCRCTDCREYHHRPTSVVKPCTVPLMLPDEIVVDA